MQIAELKKKRIPPLVAVGFALLILLGLATSLFMLRELKNFVVDAQAIDTTAFNLRASVRSVRADHLEMGQLLATRLLEPGSDFTTSAGGKQQLDEHADQLLARAIASSTSAELGGLLRSVQAQDHEVTNPLEDQVLKLAGTDSDAGRAAFLTR